MRVNNNGAETKTTQMNSQSKALKNSELNFTS